MGMRKVIDEVRETVELIYGKTPLLDAYLYRSRVKCGKPQCRCMTSNYRHETWCLSYSQDGKSRTRTVPLELLPVLRQMTINYRQISGSSYMGGQQKKVDCARDRQVRQARKKLEQLHKTLLRLLDSTTKQEVLAGRRLYKRLMIEIKQ